MPDSEDEQIRQQLIAFADGELEPSARVSVLETLARQPELIQVLREHAELTAATRRTLTVSADSAPESLRDFVSTLTIPEPRPMRLPAWLSVAAVLALSSGLALWMLLAPARDRSSGTAQRAAVIPASIVSHAGIVHDQCSRLAETLHAAPFPAEEGKLAADIEHDLKTTEPRPDLSSIGFHFTGAGPCSAIAPQTVHLLYHSSKPGSISTVSVFVQPNHDQYKMTGGEVYSLGVPESPFPMLAWRTDDVVYFLLADSNKSEQAALALIQGEQSLRAK